MITIIGDLHTKGDPQVTGLKQRSDPSITWCSELSELSELSG